MVRAMRSVVTVIAFIVVIAAVLAACKAAAGDLGEPRNFAADTVHYVESGATCEAVFTEQLVHTARCTLPNGAKLYCTADARGGSAAAWGCLTLNSPNPPQSSPPAK